MLPFKSKPKQIFSEVGDEKIGILEIPNYFCLTPNEESYINEHLQGRKSRDRIIIEFAKKVKTKRKIEDETVEAIANAIVSPKTMGIEGLSSWIELHMAKEDEQFGKDLSVNAEYTAAAHAGAIITYRLEQSDWDFGWGLSSTEGRPQEITKPLITAIASFAYLEKAGVRNKEAELDRTAEFKGFATEQVKKSSAVSQSQPEPIGAGSSG